ncbi:MAG: SUMF1/EgtB/PvdO family nonheme iron enzyme [Candidatus Brocadiae bacterium]|nr:SUMF1/EgtB/PvdO family nonheme iron enzyme [Candidatus Brocadiia bacterium]
MKKILAILLLLALLFAVFFWPEKKQSSIVPKAKESKIKQALPLKKTQEPVQKSFLDESLKQFTKAKSEVILLCEARYGRETMERLPDIKDKAYSVNSQGFLEYAHPNGIIFILVPQGKAQKNPFWLSKYEITQRQWQKIMGKNPAQNRRKADLPVESISWQELQDFCQKAGFRIPSCEEWEYACLGNSPSKFPWGDDAEKLSSHAWFDKNSGGSLQEVGKQACNPFGFYDMLGNVCEWCADKGNAPDSRIFRGGSYKHASLYCTPRYSKEASETTQIGYIGARVAMDFGEKTLELVKNPQEKERDLTNPSLPKNLSLEENGSVIIEPSHWNMGNISQEKTLHTKVSIKNQTKKEIHLLEIRSACGCVVSKPQSNSLASGQEIALDVSFNPAGRRGYQRQELRIITDHGKNKLLVFLIEGSVLLSDIISEKQINFGEFRQGSRIQRTLKIAAKENKNIEIQCTLPYFIWNTKKTMVEGFYPGKQRGWEVSISPKEDIPFGRHQGFLEISINPKEKHRIPVFAYATGPIVLSRNYISLGTTSSKRKDASFSLEVSSENQKPFALNSVSSDISFLVIETKPITDSRYAIVLKLQPPQETKQGEFRGILKIETSHPIQPLIEIPLQGFFLP